MKDTVYKRVINKEALLLKKVDGITDAAARRFIQLANSFELSIYEHLGTEIGT